MIDEISTLPGRAVGSSILLKGIADGVVVCGIASVKRKRLAEHEYFAPFGVMIVEPRLTS